MGEVKEGASNRGFRAGRGTRFRCLRLPAFHQGAKYGCLADGRVLGSGQQRQRTVFGKHTEMVKGFSGCGRLKFTSVAPAEFFEKRGVVGVPLSQLW